MGGRMNACLRSLFMVYVMVVGSRSDAAVFSSTELSKGDWSTPGYSFELSLGSRVSSLRDAGLIFGHGLQLSPSYQAVQGFRLGIDLSYQFFIQPVQGVANTFRLWAGWNPLVWYQSVVGVGWAQERRVFDIGTLAAPDWARDCELAQFPHVFQRQQLFVQTTRSFRWGPSVDVMGGYGRCRNQSREYDGRWMWATQLLFSLAWR